MIQIFWAYFLSVHVEACDANSDFQVTLVGGDGNAVQICKNSYNINRHVIN